MNFAACVGTCSLCGGRVLAPSVWMGVIPPEHSCEACGAVKRSHGPMIDMSPSPAPEVPMNEHLRSV